MGWRRCTEPSAETVRTSVSGLVDDTAAAAVDGVVTTADCEDDGGDGSECGVDACVILTGAPPTLASSVLLLLATAAISV